MVASKAAVKPIATKNNVLSQTEPVRAQNFVPLQTTYPLHVGAQNFAPKQLKQSAPPYLKNNLSVMAPGDSVMNKQQVMCKESQRSLRFGILSLTIPILAGLIALLLIVLFPQPVGCVTQGFIAGYIVVAISLMGSTVLIILALVFGIKALIKIHKQPEKYKGTGKAIAGILLALSLIIIPLLLWLINTIINLNQ